MSICITSMIVISSIARVNVWSALGRLFLPQLTWRRPVSEKVVYLTFDDGPHPEITPWVLSELDKVGAKATFFVVGDNASRYQNVISQIRSLGHRLGNHTQHHVKGWRVKSSAYLNEIQLCENEIGKEGLFRPPYGQVNFGAISDISNSYEIIMWDILTKDYLKTLHVNRAFRRIVRDTKSGSIVVFHDSEKAEKNLKKLLPLYLDYLDKEGYQMKVL